MVGWLFWGTKVSRFSIEPRVHLKLFKELIKTFGNGLLPIWPVDTTRRIRLWFQDQVRIFSHIKERNRSLCKPLSWTPMVRVVTH